MAGKLLRRGRTLWTLLTARGPVYVILYLTARCNFRCPMCFYLKEVKDPEKEELGLEEIEKLSASLGRMVHLSVTGGEPFLRDDIPEVVDIFVRNNGIQYVTIPTNGWLTERIAATVSALVAAYPQVNFRVPVSLDGFPEDHDRIRRAGSFARIEATVAALERIRQRVDNLVVDLNTCYSALNYEKLDGLVEFVAGRFSVDNHTVTYVRGNAEERTKRATTAGYRRYVEDIRRWCSAQESRPFSWLLRAVMDYQRDVILDTLEHDRTVLPCVAGRKMIVVSEKGEVLPCEVLNRRLGRLADHDGNAKRLLGTPEARELVKWIRRTRCHCTFECALATSIIHHPASYPRILWRALQAWRRRRPQKAAAGQPAAPGTGQLIQLRIEGCKL